MTVAELIKKLQGFDGTREVAIDSSANEYRSGVESVSLQSVDAFCEETGAYDLGHSDVVVLTITNACPWVQS